MHINKDFKTRNFYLTYVISSQINITYYVIQNTILPLNK